MTDAEVVAEWRSKPDPELFRMLVERHQERVFRVVLSVLGPAHGAEAEEVTQEVFLQVYQKLAGFREEAQFSTWLYRVAWNRAVDYRRGAVYRHPFLPDTVLATIAAPSDPHAEFELAERRRRVLDALETLPELYRTLVHMYYWLGFSLAEIRELIGVPEGTAKSYLARARQKLEKELTHG